MKKLKTEFIIKYCILYFIAVSILFAVSNAKAQTHEHASYINTVAAGFGFSLGNNNGIYYSYSAEYTRLIKNRLRWGLTASFNNNMGTHTAYDLNTSGPGPYKNPYRNTIDMDISTLIGMIYYELPATRWLAFRSGAGLGIGYHSIKKADTDIYNDKIAPYIQMKLQWVLRPCKRMEICFAPLLLGPSTVTVAPWVFGVPSDKKLLTRFDLYHIQIGYKF
ncbi:MAG: hypothetical protein LBV47_03445 [Bacteroidales bacterium]|jgi:hypothetical protein|nr:hypothetical protein [Bacteroidales bacterium]